jgi:hypothetical protein
MKRHELVLLCLTKRKHCTINADSFRDHTKVDPRVKATIGAEQVHSRLAIIALACLVNFGLRQHNEAGSVVVPLELNLVAFEEVLLRGRAVEFWHIVDTN